MYPFLRVHQKVKKGAGVKQTLGKAIKQAGTISNHGEKSYWHFINIEELSVVVSDITLWRKLLLFGGNFTFAFSLGNKIVPGQTWEQRVVIIGLLFEIGLAGFLNDQLKPLAW